MVRIKNPNEWKLKGFRKSKRKNSMYDAILIKKKR